MLNGIPQPIARPQRVVGIGQRGPQRRGGGLDFDADTTGLKIRFRRKPIVGQLAPFVAGWNLGASNLTIREPVRVNDCQVGEIVRDDANAAHRADRLGRNQIGFADITSYGRNPLMRFFAVTPMRFLPHSNQMANAKLHVVVVRRGDRHDRGHHRGSGNVGRFQRAKMLKRLGTVTAK